MTAAANTSLVVGAPSSWIASQNTKEQRDSDLPGDGREPMKPLFYGVVLTVTQNMGKAINLYRLGGVIGLLLGVAESVTAFSASSLNRRANKP
jgi:hypothetical protein